MHRSRVYGLFIDVSSSEVEASVAFWSAALGADPQTSAGEEHFTRLRDALPGLIVGTQEIDDEPRYHIDIETDDVDAEVARLRALGAVEVSRWLDCHVLRAPGGHLLCVIPVHSAPEIFRAHARTWS